MMYVYVLQNAGEKIKSRAEDTLKRKHELKISEVCLSCGNAITIINYLGLHYLAFNYFSLIL